MISHDFISELDAHRDDLYSRALAAASAAPEAAGLSPSAIHIRAEVILQSAIRETFAQCERDADLIPFEAVQQHLPPLPTTQSVVPMPADIWARLVAAIQVEAARLSHSKGINPDSVLLSPDPLLAPKKPGAPDPIEGLGLLPEYRFFFAAAIAIIVAIVLTIYLLTRSGGGEPNLPIEAPETQPATQTEGQGDKEMGGQGGKEAEGPGE